MWHFLLNFRPAQTCSVVDPPLGASGDKGWKLANFYVLFASSNNIYVRAPPFTLYIQIRSKRDFLPSDQAFNVLLPCKVLLRCMVGCMESHLKREGVIWKSDWGPWFVFRFAIPARRYPHIFPTSILTNVSIFFLNRPLLGGREFVTNHIAKEHFPNSDKYECICFLKLFVLCK